MNTTILEDITNALLIITLILAIIATSMIITEVYYNGFSNSNCNYTIKIIYK